MKRKLKSNTIVEFNPELEELNGLLKIYASLQSVLFNKKSNNVKLFSTRNIVGEYAELYCCEKLNLTQEVASNAYYDAVDMNGAKYQIKSRLSDGIKLEDQFGDIKEAAIDNIDYVLLVYFNPDFTINYLYKIERDFYKKVANHKKGVYKMVALKSMLKTFNENIGKGVEKIV